MNVLQSRVFIGCCIIFLAHQWLQHIADIDCGLADDYLDNFLALPIILTLLQTERNLLFKSQKSRNLTDMEITIATLYIIITGELVFPYLTSRFIADWIDIPFYIAGAICFKTLIQNSK